MKRKNILLIKGSGVYGATRRYIDEFAAALQELGYNTIVLDGMAKAFEEKHQWVLDHYAIYAVVDCQAVTLELLPGYKYDKGIAQVHYFCDHPLYHYRRLERLDKDNIILNVDRKHTEYIHKYYSKFMRAEYVPLSGSGADTLLPYEEREIDVLFTGSYWVPNEPVQVGAGAGFAEIVKWKVQQGMIANPYESIEEVLSEVLGEYPIEVMGEEFRGILAELKNIEFYARVYYRDKMMRTLLKAGIEVSVFGDGWEELHCEGIEHLHILKGGTEVAQRALGHAKIALNIMPGFKAGFQERIAAAMLSGTVVVTDVSTYLEEEFSDGKELVFYYLEQMEELPVKIKELLSDNKKCRQIADSGKKIAEEKHMWKHRVRQMAEQIERYHGAVYEEAECSGIEIKIPIELGRTSYLVEEIREQLCEEINIVNDLNNNGYAEYKDGKQLLQKLRMWHWQLEQLCEYHFFSGNNLELFISYFEETLKKKERFAETMLLLLLMADGFWCGVKEKCEAIGIEEFAMGAPAGKNEELYDKLLTAFMREKYKNNEEEELAPWRADLITGQFLKSYPQQLICKYADYVVDIQYDEEADMLYVLHYGKRMYFPRAYTVQQVYIAYRFCCIEQDVESSHRYLDDCFDVPEGAVVIDAGVAEGNFALEIIERVKKIYLVECDEKWFSALERTFAPYKDKVVFVPKMLGNRADEKYITIDAMMGGEMVDFIKMDVEGAEADALLGAEQTLARNKNMKCAIATYHAHGMGERVKQFLQDRGFTVSETKGYIFYKDYKKPIWENELRHALVRAER